MSLAICTVSCAEKGSSQPGGDPVGLIEMSINTGRYPEASVGSKKAVWYEGDAIAVFDGQKANRFAAVSGGETAIFKGNAAKSDSYMFVFPWMEGAGFSGTTEAEACLNHKQKAVCGAYDLESAPLAGEYRLGSNGASLRLACAFLKFELTESGLTGVRISSTDSTPLSGKFTLRLKNRIPEIINISEGKDCVELSSEKGSLEAGTYFAPVLPGTYAGGISLSTCNSEGVWKTVSTSGPLTLERAQTYALSGSEAENPGTDFEDEANDPSADPVSSYGLDYKLLARAGHPRLLLREDELEAYRKRVLVDKKADDYVYLLHTKAMKMAETQLNTTDQIRHELIDGKRMLSYSMIALRRMFACSYAYRITGEARYLSRVREDLATILTFPDWNPSHYLDVGEMSLAVSLAYDWLYYDLSLEERKAIHSILKSHALGTYANKGYLRDISNWNQVCNAGIIAAAITLYEKDKAICAKAIETGVGSNLTAAAGIYNPDGNTHEGYSYWAYGTDFQVILLQMLDSAFGHCAGIDKTEGLKKTGKFILYMGGPVGTFSFADGGSEGKTKSRFSQWWLASHYNQPADLCQEIAGFKAGKYNTPSDRLFCSVPLALFRNPVSITEGQYPSKKLWTGNGLCPVAMIRSGWTGSDSDIYVGFKGGGAGTTHSHLDAGSFVFDCKGVRWSEDLSIGSYAPYEHTISDFWKLTQSSRRWDVLRANNLMHSTIAFENSDGSVSDKLHVTDQRAGEWYATISDSFENSSEVGATMDLTPLYSDQVASAKRTVKLVANKNLVIVDVIKAKPGMDAKMQWRMLTAAQVTAGSRYSSLVRNNMTMFLSAVTDDASATPVYTRWDSSRPSNWADRGWDTTVEPDNSGYSIAGFTLTVSAGRTVTVTTTLSFDRPNY